MISTAVANRSPGPDVPLVSIVIPARNCPTLLRRCLQAVQATEYPHYEVIVVDDASTDDTAAVAREFGARVVEMDNRKGPAVARNHGAGAALGEYVYFIDADVCVHPDSVGQVAAAFAEDETVDALFGSYDLQPGAPNFISQFKNLFHHFVHQEAGEEAATFWTGCGAVKRSVFLAMGGFTADYGRPAIEDIEFGVRLKRAGHRIRLRKQLQVTHLKKWTLWGLIKTDVRDRGIPWTCLIHREKNLPNDLNLTLASRLSAMVAGLLVLGLCIAVAVEPMLALALVVGLAGITVLECWSRYWGQSTTLEIFNACCVAGALAIAWHFVGAWAAVPLLALVLIVILRHRFYAFFIRQRGLGFALAAVPLHVLYFNYSVFAFLVGTLLHLSRSRRPAPTPVAGELANPESDLKPARDPS